MPVSRQVLGLCLLALATGPAQAQSGGPDADALKASVMQVLSLATFGMISIPDQGVAVTRKGQDYRMRLPLSGFATPADAAVTAVARPRASGKVDIESMAFPASGSVDVPLSTGLINRIEFRLGKQTISGTVDPTLATESTYAADFGDVRMTTTQGEQHDEQTIDHVATDGTFSASSDQRLNFMAQTRGTGFHMIGHGSNGLMSDTGVRALAGHFSVEGLDRAQGARMLAAFRSLVAAGAQDPLTEGDAPQPVMSPEQRRNLGAVVAALDGLLNRAEVDETMEKIQFSVETATGGAAGTIGSMRLVMDGASAQDRLNAGLEITLKEIAVPAMAAEAGGLFPRHVDLRTVLAGVAVTGLKALLREATQDHPDPALMEAHARSLLGDPLARIAIETLAFDAGPLSVTGSAKLVPRADGQLGSEIHIAARGVDALLAQVQSQPKLQQAIPLIFIAKGMSRAQGDSLVWDIVLGDGAPRINGTSFGQPAGNTR